MKEAGDEYGCAIHAYVLMTNHVHLLLTPSTEEAAGKVMQTLGRRYVRYINHTYQRTGTLWEGRYKSSLIDSEHYLLTCHRYIELNPVRAGMVGHPLNYVWSSYHHNAAGKRDPLIEEHAGYLALGASASLRQNAYRQLFETHIDETCLEEIRNNTNKGWVLGNERFKEQIEHQLKRRVRPLPRGGDRRKKSSKLL